MLRAPGRAAAHDRAPWPLACTASREARSYLPFWQTAPVIRGIARILRLLFRGRAQQQLPLSSSARNGRSAAPGGNPHGVPADAAASAAPGAKAASEKLAMQRLQGSIRSLLSSLVPADMNLDTVLDDLVEKWNPLIDPGPKEDLVRDVNALAQDFIQPIRRAFLAQPPDLSRITSLAEQLSASRSLAQIRNREPLVRYLQMYMLKTLLG